VTRRQLFPAVTLLGFAAAAEAATAGVRLWKGGDPVWSAAAPLVMAAVLAAAAVVIATRRPPPTVPSWSRSFEVLRTATGVVTRCTDCDDLVIVGTAAPLPVWRILNYIHGHHLSELCIRRQRDRAAADRLSPQYRADRARAIAATIEASRRTAGEGETDGGR